MLAPLGNFRFNENFLFNLYYAVLSMQRSSSDIIFSSSHSRLFVPTFFLLIRLSRLVYRLSTPRHWILLPLNDCLITLLLPTLVISLFCMSYVVFSSRFHFLLIFFHLFVKNASLKIDISTEPLRIKEEAK